MAEAPDPKATIPFHEFFERLSAGTPHAEAQAALAALVEDVDRLGKKGTMTVLFEVEPAGDAGRQVLIAAKVTSKPPEPKPAPSVFYVGFAGTVHREDPYQRPFDGMETPRAIPDPEQPRLVDDDADTQGATNA